MISRRVLVSWSSGKDSAWTLHVLRQQPDVEIVGLLTTFNEAANRVAMHAVRRTLVEAQASASGLPLWPVPLRWPCSNAAYEERMSAVIDRAQEEGITHVAFGDLFLEDVRNYRIRQLSGTGVEPLFPLWGSPADTPDLARRMLAAAASAGPSGTTAQPSRPATSRITAGGPTSGIVRPDVLPPQLGGGAFSQP